MAQRILVVDDDEQIREVLRILLSNEGFEVVEAADGMAAEALTDESIDLILLDVMMPGQDGLRTCMGIRKKSSAPIIFLTAKAQDSDKTMGFAVGGDDYLAKPFSAAELLARVKAALRRYLQYGSKTAPEAEERIELGELIIDLTQRRCYINEDELPLTDTEFRILLLLAGHRKQIFSVQNIYESVWEEPYFYSANNTVMVHIRNLRRKLESAGGSDPIKTMWGRGYRVD